VCSVVGKGSACAMLFLLATRCDARRISRQISSGHEGYVSRWLSFVLFQRNEHESYRSDDSVRDHVGDRNGYEEHDRN
jgi:hypothetical protein